MAKNIFSHLVGAFDIFGVVIDVALVMALYPTIVGFIDAAEANMSSGEIALAGLLPLVLVIALVVMVGKQLGVIGKK